MEQPARAQFDLRAVVSIDMAVDLPAPLFREAE
jgi:hypothetical protein